MTWRRGCPPHLLVHRVGQPPPRHRHRSWSWSNSKGSTCLCLWGSSKIFHSPYFKDKAWRNGSMLFLSPSRPSRRTPSPFWWCWRACVLHGASTGRPLEVCQSCRNPDGNPQQALNHVPRTGVYLLLCYSVYQVLSSYTMNSIILPSMVEYLQTAWTPWRIIVLGVESTSVSWCYDASTNALGRWRIALLLSSSWPDHTHWLDLCQAQQINLRTFRQALQNPGLAHLVLRFGAGTSAPWEQDSSRHAQSLHTHEEEEGRKKDIPHSGVR